MARHDGAAEHDHVGAVALDQGPTAAIRRGPIAASAVSEARASMGRLPGIAIPTPIWRTMRRWRRTLPSDRATMPKRSPSVRARRIPHSAMPITGRPRAASGPRAGPDR